MNWNRLISIHPPVQVLPAAVFRSALAALAARAASGAPLRVIANVDAAGNASTFSVAPGQGRPPG